MKFRTDLSAEEVRFLLHYDSVSGRFFWAVKRGRVRPGQETGVRDSSGAVLIGIHGKTYLAHRVAWLHVYGHWPDGVVDHINGRRDDNRIANLRVCTQSQNIANSRLNIRNSVGLKGVTFDRERQVYKAQIRVNYKTRVIGRFRSAEEAHAAYRQAAAQNFGEFARFH